MVGVEDFRDMADAMLRAMDSSWCRTASFREGMRCWATSLGMTFAAATDSGRELAMRYREIFWLITGRRVNCGRRCRHMRRRLPQACFTTRGFRESTISGGAERIAFFRRPELAAG